MPGTTNDHRNAILENIRIASQQLDKQIAFIAGGAFAIVAVFVDKIVPLQTAYCKLCLIISLASFAASIILALLANYNSITIHSWALENEDLSDDVFNKQLIEKNKLIRCLNFSSIIAILIGGICLIWFLSFNIYKMNTEDNKNNKVTINIPVKSDEKIRGLAMEVPTRPVKPTITVNTNDSSNINNSDKK